MSQELYIGNWVYITKDGAKAHRKHHNTENLAIGALVGAITVPLILLGAFLAAVGVAGGGAGFALGVGITAFVKNFFMQHPEAQALGVIHKKEPRWWWEEGYDYHVIWANPEPLGESNWHISEHLVRTNSPY